MAKPEMNQFLFNNAIEMIKDGNKTIKVDDLVTLDNFDDMISKVYKQEFEEIFEKNKIEPKEYKKQIKILKNELANIPPKAKLTMLLDKTIHKSIEGALREHRPGKRSIMQYFTGRKSFTKGFVGSDKPGQEKPGALKNRMKIIINNLKPDTSPTQTNTIEDVKIKKEAPWKKILKSHNKAVTENSKKAQENIDRAEKEKRTRKNVIMGKMTKLVSKKSGKNRNSSLSR